MWLCVIVYVFLGICVLLKRAGKLPEALCKKEGRQMFLILLGSTSLALALFAGAGTGSVIGNGNALERNTYGGGKRIEKLEATIAGKLKKEPITVEIQERVYTKEEIQKEFKKAEKKLDQLILGPNKSADYITDDMNLITEIPGTPITVRWETDHYQIININGEIQQKNVAEEGTLVNLKGLMEYNGESAIYSISVMVYPPIRTAGKKTAYELQHMIRLEDENTKEHKNLKLPASFEGRKIRWSVPQDTRGYWVLFLGVAAALLMLLLKKQNQQKKQIERNRQMAADYPDIVNKMILLLGAGMTVKNAWSRITKDYLIQKERKDTRYAYEEMEYAWHEMQSGIPEVQSYERFGKRCGLTPYLRFGILLSQNLRKGTKGLASLLKAEEIQAYEERKNAAKRLGEEAGTKLLIPMFLMLTVVLVMIVIPAFLSVRVS